jgi:hypothetical protein
MTETKQQRKAPGIRKVIVTASALTIRIGKGKGDVLRAKKGDVISFRPGDERLKTFLAGKAVAPYREGEPLPKGATVMTVAHALGADDDPARPPMQSILPVEPSAEAVRLAKQ